MATTIGSKGLSFRKNKRKQASAGSVKSIFWFIVQIVIVLFMAFVIVYCAGTQVTVVGNSMEPNLKESETVLVNRFTYNLTGLKSGDVIVFLPNGNEKSHYYVKRVIAVPGDKVQIISGLVYVNGEQYAEDFDVEAMRNAGLAEEEIVVGDDEYFVLGDNRNNSEDSRFANLGNIHTDDILGKAWFVISPYNEMRPVK